MRPRATGRLSRCPNWPSMKTLMGRQPAGRCQQCGMPEPLPPAACTLACALPLGDRSARGRYVGHTLPGSTVSCQLPGKLCGGTQQPLTQPNRLNLRRAASMAGGQRCRLVRKAEDSAAPVHHCIRPTCTSRSGRLPPPGPWMIAGAALRREGTAASRRPAGGPTPLPSPLAHGGSWAHLHCDGVS